MDIPLSFRQIGTSEGKSKMKKFKIENILPGVERNISLKEYTTFKIGGSAKYFFEAKTEQEIIKAITVAKQLKLPFFVLGGGSNILVDDKGYKGLVIKIKNNEIKIKNNKIEVGAGVMLGRVVNIATKNNLSGMEWAAGIPGTIGGSIWGNAGAFNSSMSNIIKFVKVLDIKKNFKSINFNNKDCKFEYRDSIFKKKQNIIIISVEINLKKSNKKIINNKVKEYFNYRIKHQPLNIPSAGSIFKNNVKFSAGELIEKCGLKGNSIGGAKISEKHANFIVNFKNATAKDVQSLINLAKKRTKTKFGVVLREEINFL